MLDTEDPSDLGAQLSAIADGIGAEIGTPFLERLVYTLRSCMEASLVMLTSGEGDPVRRINATYAIEEGLPTAFSYRIEDTPCARVYAGEEVFVPCALAEAYPLEAGFEGYVGVPVRSEDGSRVDGHLAVLSAQPIADLAAARAIVRIFARRVEAEHRHAQLRDERERLIGLLYERNAELRRRYQDIHDANAYKTRLLGLIAHDLRNPLTAVLSQVELMQALLGRPDPARERLLRCCGRVETAADRMSGLITATLERAREETRGLELDVQRADLAAIAAVAVDVNRREAERKRISLTLDAPSEVAVGADRELTIEAIDNLVSNAIKYSHPGGSVRVRVARDMDTALAEVSDNGQGLSAADLERAFGRFQMLSAQPTGGESSTGLGLSIVREIVEAHGGSVAAESPGPGEGATFRICLPLDATAPDDGV